MHPDLKVTIPISLQPEPVRMIGQGQWSNYRPLPMTSRAIFNAGFELGYAPRWTLGDG